MDEIWRLKLCRPSLPAELRAPDISHTVFRNKLKSYVLDIA